MPSTTDKIPLPTQALPPGAPWWLSDAAPYLGVSLRHLHRLADHGKVRTIRLGRRRLIPDEEVQRLAREGC